MSSAEDETRSFSERKGDLKLGRIIPTSADANRSNLRVKLHAGDHTLGKNEKPQDEASKMSF